MKLVNLDLTERVAWVTLDNPPSNRLSVEALRTLDQVVTEVAANAEASVMVLSGAGDEAFCAGVEIGDRAPDRLPTLVPALHGLMRKLVRQPQVTVAAIDGVALGAGLELANLCDIVVASDRSRFGYPEIHQACFPAAALVTLPTVGGRPAGSDLILTGQTIDARKAQALGLCSRIFRSEEFTENLSRLVAGLAAKSPTALRLTAQRLRSHWLGTFDSELNATEALLLGELARHPDLAEGTRAALERRDPVWS